MARAVAFAGMLLAHYVWPHRPNQPGWLLAIDAGADGRPAPLFCVLLGVSAGLLLARGTPDRVLIGRGACLFALTAYLAHLLLGRQLLWGWNDRSTPSLAVQMGVVGLILAVFAALATVWRMRFRRGPVEGLLRAVTS